MNPTARKILLYLKSNPHATYADIGKAVNIGKTGSVAHNIQTLTGQGFLKRINPKWQLTKQAAKVLGERE